jgi:RNA polymerase sigma factor (sigma-70 family)
MQRRRGADKMANVKILFEQYEGRLLRYCMRMVNDESAREIVQDSFLKLWQHVDTLEEEHVVQWLYTVSRNHCLDILRKNKTMKPVNFEDDEHVGESNPEQDYEAGRRKQVTLRLIRSLPDREQEVVRLKFDENLSYQQISAITGITVNYVGVMIHNALAKLRVEYSRIEETKEAL